MVLFTIFIIICRPANIYLILIYDGLVFIGSKNSKPLKINVLTKSDSFSRVCKETGAIKKMAKLLCDFKNFPNFYSVYIFSVATKIGNDR